MDYVPPTPNMHAHTPTPPPAYSIQMLSHLVRTLRFVQEVTLWLFPWPTASPDTYLKPGGAEAGGKVPAGTVRNYIFPGRALPTSLWDAPHRKAGSSPRHRWNWWRLVQASLVAQKVKNLPAMQEIRV